MDTKATVKRSDVIRAIRQCMADEGIDLHSIVQEAVDGAIAKALRRIDMTPHIKKYVANAVIGQMWEIRQSVADAIAKRITINVPSDLAAHTPTTPTTGPGEG